MVLTILPTIFIYLSISFDAETSKKFSDFYSSGEFFLYGVSFSSSAFLVYNGKKKEKSYFPLIMIILSSIAYSVTLNAKKPDIDIISYYSLTSFFISLFVFYFSQVFSNKLSSSIDVRDYRREEQNTIEQGLS
jgi:hypothetical protein